MQEQIAILDNVKANIKDGFLDKLNASISKNPDLLKFTSEDNSLEFRLLTKFAPLVTVDVERSFSKYNDLLSDEKRTRLTKEHLEMILCIQINGDM